MRLQFFSLLFLALFMASADNSHGVIKGHVVSPSGSPGSHTQIRVVQWYFVNGEPRTNFDKADYTNSDGNYSIDVPPGVYDVFISRADSEPTAKKLKVVSEKETTFDVKLVGSPAAEFIE